MSSFVPPSVAKTTRAVLLSSQKGVALQKFCSDYKCLVGDHFPWRRLRFHSSLELLRAMPDVVRFEVTENDYWLYGICDKKKFVSSWFLKAEGSQSQNRQLHSQRIERCQVAGKIDQSYSRQIEGCQVARKRKKKSGSRRKRDKANKFKSSPHACGVATLGISLCRDEPCRSHDVLKPHTPKSCDHSPKSCGHSPKSCDHSPNSHDLPPKPAPTSTSSSFDSALSDSDSEWDEDLLDDPIPVHLLSKLHVSPSPLVDAHDFPFPCQLSGFHVPNASGLIPVTTALSELTPYDWLGLKLSLQPDKDLEVMSTYIASCHPQKTDRVDVGKDFCVSVLAAPQQRERVCYRRAKVVGVQFNQVEVLYIDTGVLAKFPLSHFHTLPPSVNIGRVPPLAIPSRINGLVSTLGENWYPLDIQLLWKHLLNKQVFANFVKNPSITTTTSATTNEPIREQLAIVDLYFDPGGCDSIAKVMVKEGVHLGIENPFSEVSFVKVEQEMSIDIGMGIENRIRDDVSFVKVEKEISTASFYSEMPELMSGDDASVVVFGPWQKMKAAYSMID